MRYVGFGLVVLLLMSGCVRRVRHIPMEEMLENNETNITGTLYDTSQTEAQYNLKPEPYSVSSKEKDPELLGPQQTVEVAPESVATVTTEPKKPSTSTAASMTKSECISMTGATKFARYSKRFGGESGAIKRCAILKKLKG